MPSTSVHTLAVKNVLEHLEKLIHFRIKHPSESIPDSFYANALPSKSHFQLLLQKKDYGFAEQIALALAFARATKPEVFFPLIQASGESLKQMQIGGQVITSSVLRFIPTLQTLIYLLAGDDFLVQQFYLRHFHPKHSLFLEDMIYLEGGQSKKKQGEDDPIYREMRLSYPYLRYFLGGEAPRLDEEPNFPASLSETSLNFEDVILPDNTREELQDLIKYLKNRDRLFEMEGVEARIRPSYVVIFAGMPGMGKTITAKTIGKSIGVPVYIVNLARVVSKYIGETEKNLEKIFDRFDKQNCILFFDEADALFGKRTEVKDAKDRYANQEVAYLLQKIENFQGLVILATNVHDIENTFDKAFQRRIRRIILFPFPNENERLKIWEKALPASFKYEEGLLPKLAANYQLNGAGIANVISDALVEAVDQKTNILSLEILEPFMKIEYKRRRVMYEVCQDHIAVKDLKKRYGLQPKQGF